MLYVMLKVAVKGIRDTFVACQSLKGNGVDEVTGVGSHNDVNLCALFDEAACKVCALICRDASADAQEDGFILKHVCDLLM